MYRGPGAYLIRVSPNAKKGADVLSQPNEEPNPDERQEQWHVAIHVVRAEHHRRPGIEPKDARGEVPAVIAYIEC